MIAGAHFIKDNAIIAIIRGVSPEEAVDVAQTMYEAGIRVIEVPLNSPDPFSSIERIVDAIGEKMLVGAGTVLTVDDVKRLKDVGGELVVSPDMNPEIIDQSKQRDMLSFPGVMTVSEVLQATRFGADGLKLFPANVVGKEFIKATKVIMPKPVPVAVVGGIDVANVLEWQRAGADLFGLGSSLYKPGMTLDVIYSKSKLILEELDHQD